MGHAGEFLQGVIEEDHEQHAVLISIPVPELGSRACFQFAAGAGLAVHPHWKRKSLRAFELAWKSLSSSPPAGHLRMASDLPVSRGMGSSTADCVAAIRVAARAHGRTLSPAQVAWLAHQAEQNSDATMYGAQLVLFRHCEGKVHRELPGSGPRFDRVLVELAAGVRPVETDCLSRPAYTPAEIAEFNNLVARFSCAAQGSDLAGIGAVAERSADINQRYHPISRLLEVRAIARGLGAFGTAIAHSGDLQIMLFPQGALSEDRQSDLRQELARNGMKVWRILTDRGDGREACCEGSEADQVAQQPAGAIEA